MTESDLKYNNNHLFYPARLGWRWSGRQGTGPGGSGGGSRGQGQDGHVQGARHEHGRSV